MHWQHNFHWIVASLPLSNAKMSTLTKCYKAVISTSFLAAQLSRGCAVGMTISRQRDQDAAEGALPNYPSSAYVNA